MRRPAPQLFYNIVAKDSSIFKCCKAPEIYDLVLCPSLLLDEAPISIALDISLPSVKVSADAFELEMGMFLL